MKKKCDLPEQFGQVIQSFMDGLGTSVSDKVLRLYRDGKWDELCAMRVHPADYDCANSYWRDHQACAFLRKLSDLPLGRNLHEEAVKSFYESEAQCKRTNDHLNRLLYDGLLESTADLRSVEFLHAVRQEVRLIMGPLPNSLSHDMGFGPGSTFADLVPLTTVPDKMSIRPTITQSARDLLPIWSETAWARVALSGDRSFISDPSTIKGNRFTSVKKDSEKNRGICVEPSLNGWFQRAAGRHLRKRLRLFGIDLKHGQFAHRVAAKRGSLYGDRATLDVKSASDTLSRVLVDFLCSSLWGEFLNSIRSPFTRVGKHWVRLEKFSSMGNGFTFELETVIFHAISRVVVKWHGLDPAEEVKHGRLLQYGDDCVAPTAVALDVCAAFRLCGFEMNVKKTFIEGPFRESCGGDYFRGEPVTAHYQQEIPQTPQQWIAMANGVRRCALGHERFPLRFWQIEKAWLSILSNLPSELRRLYGPQYLGDSVIHTNPSLWRPKNVDGLTFFKGYVASQQPLPWKHWTANVAFASALYGVPSAGPLERDGVKGYRVEWIGLETYRTSSKRRSFNDVAA